MNTEDLSIPRIQVSIQMPGGPKAGTVYLLNLKWGSSPATRLKMYIGDSELHYWPLSEFQKFPDCFREMQWWEDRAVEDLPKYLRVNTEKTSLFKGDIHKVREIGVFEGEVRVGASQLFVRIEGKDDFYRFNLNHFLPATEEEYNAQHPS